MDFINLKSLNLTAEESEDLIKFLAQKRRITTKKLLSTIKQRKLKKQQQTLSNTKKIRNAFYNIGKKINNTNDDFIENIRDLFNTNVDEKINKTNVNKKINNTNDEDFIENIRDLFNNKLDKKKLIIILMMIL